VKSCALPAAPLRLSWVMNATLPCKRRTIGHCSHLNSTVVMHPIICRQSAVVSDRCSLESHLSNLASSSRRHTGPEPGQRRRGPADRGAGSFRSPRRTAGPRHGLRGSRSSDELGGNSSGSAPLRMHRTDSTPSSPTNSTGRLPKLKRIEREQARGSRSAKLRRVANSRLVGLSAASCCSSSTSISVVSTRTSALSTPPSSATSNSYRRAFAMRDRLCVRHVMKAQIPFTRRGLSARA
jgi:hypothetical protein